MLKDTYILGINCTYHELAACLIKNGVLLVATEEERFSRIKHGKQALIDNPDVLPLQAIDYCLKFADITWQDITWIGLSFSPKLRLRNIDIDSYFDKEGWGSKIGEQTFYTKLMGIPKLLTEHAGTNLDKKIKWIPHHLCHAASAYFVSPFKESAVLSIDGIGEVTSTWLGNGKGNKLHKIKEISYPNSIGFLWEKFSKFLGFSEYDAGKVMGLSAYGDWQVFYPEFKRIIKISKNSFTVDNSILKFRQNDFKSLEKLFGVKKISSPDERNKNHEHIAAALQKVTNEVFVTLAGYLANKVKSENICLAGGVALNCSANEAIMNSGYYKRVYVQPAAHDAGTALGAAYYIWNHLLNGQRKFVMEHAFWGPEYGDSYIEDILNQQRLKYRFVKNIERETAKLISKGYIIGWMQGRLEWGPRALGNRSLLVDPREKKMKKILNLRIKKRELFRPFAPSVLAEDAKSWFEIPKNSQSISTDFMEFTFPVKKAKRSLIPAVVHVDGTSRIQTVRKQTNSKYHKLLSEFKRITQIPMVLNTSFNDNEPIVCSPIDAINTFKRTKMDYLIIGNFLISK